MMTKSAFFCLLVAVIPTFGRTLLLERDGRAIYARRFGQENPASLQLIANAGCGGQCQTFAGQAVSTLLAGAPECAQQDLADDIIDASKEQADAAVAQRMVEAAIALRTAEKNTPPDFTTNPPTNRNSVFCQTPPRNAELVGLNQAQDPANDPNIFFDPATRASVLLGEQANTTPLGGAAKRLTRRYHRRQNIFRFSEALGGVQIPAVSQNGDGRFQVAGNASFNNLANALVRACDVQNNQCANFANSQADSAFSVSDCNAQQAQCIAQSRANA